MNRTAAVYVERPSIPEGMTIADYRHLRREQRPVGGLQKAAMAALFPLRFYASLTEPKPR